MKALKIVLMMSAACVMRAQSATAESAKVSYADGQLKIEAFDCPLSDILAKVATATGVKLDLPDGVKDERVFITLGPGPAGRILAALLADTNVDYLIQESDTDKGGIRRVVLMAREKKPAGPPATQGAANNLRNPYARAAAAEAAPAPDNPAPAQSENAVGVTDSSNSPPPAAQPSQSAPPSTQADATGQPPDPPAQAQAVQPDAPTQPLSQPGFLNGQKVAPVNPPVSLDSQTISQQLQQMYQQRMQLTQQDRQTSGSGTFPNAGGK